MTPPPAAATPDPTEEPSAATPGMTPASVMRELFVTVLRRSALVIGVIAVLACGLGILLSGPPGLYGALIGVALAASYLLVTIVVMILTSDRHQALVSAGIAGSWLLKVLVTLLVIYLLRGKDFYDPLVLVVTVGVAVFATLAVEATTVLSARVPLGRIGEDDPAVRG